MEQRLELYECALKRVQQVVGGKTSFQCKKYARFAAMRPDAMPRVLLLQLL